MPATPKYRNVVHVTLSYGGGLQTALNKFVEKQKNGNHLIITFGKEDKFVKNELTSNVIISNFKQCVFEIFNADVVFLHSTRSGFLRPLVKLIGKHVVFMPHSLHFSQKNMFFFTKIISVNIERFLSMFTDSYLLLGWHEVLSLKKIGVNKAYNIIGNGFQADTFKQVELIRFPDKYILLCGRLHKQKNPMLLLYLMSVIKKYQYSVVWIGDGDEEMKAELENNGIIVTGWIDSNQVCSYMRNSNFILHIAETEGLPVVFLEACRFAQSKIICIKKDYSWFFPKKYKFNTPLQFENILTEIEKTGDYFSTLNRILKKRFETGKIEKKWHKVMKEILYDRKVDKYK